MLEVVSSFHIDNPLTPIISPITTPTTPQNPPTTPCLTHMELICPSARRAHVAYAVVIQYRDSVTRLSTHLYLGEKTPDGPLMNKQTWCCNILIFAKFACPCSYLRLIWRVRVFVDYVGTRILNLNIPLKRTTDDIFSASARFSPCYSMNQPFRVYGLKIAEIFDTKIHHARSKLWAW